MRRWSGGGWHVREDGASVASRSEKMERQWLVGPGEGRDFGALGSRKGNGFGLFQMGVMEKKKKRNKYWGGRMARVFFFRKGPRQLVLSYFVIALF